MEIILAAAVFCSACGSRTGQDRNESERNQDQSYQQGNEQLARLRATYGAADFPGSLSTSPFTYDIQRFFIELMGKPVLFEAYVEDVEETKDGVLVEFTRTISPSMIEDGVTVGAVRQLARRE
jgi:hypothetical protein